MGIIDISTWYVDAHVCYYVIIHQVYLINDNDTLVSAVTPTRTGKLQRCKLREIAALSSTELVAVVANANVAPARAE